MKHDPHIRRAIDESLSSVHFDTRDTYAVLRSVRQGKPQRRSARRLSLMPALALAALILVPASLLGSGILSAAPKDITTIASHGNTPGETQPGGNPLSDVSIPLITEEKAIAAARRCFEAQCNTEVFSFDEYTVSVQAEFEYGSTPPDQRYVVTMESIYGNGCMFRVVIGAQDGEILSYSAPQQATLPAQPLPESAQTQAWYDKYGPYRFTWPQDAQIEFSRRYEGARIRAAHEDEASPETIARRFGVHVYELTEQTGEQSIAYYIQLLDGRAFDDGRARYLVFCFPGKDITDTLPDTYMRLTFLAADGAYESGEILSTDGL